MSVCGCSSAYLKKKKQKETIDVGVNFDRVDDPSFKFQAIGVMDPCSDPHLVAMNCWIMKFWATPNGIQNRSH